MKSKEKGVNECGDERQSPVGKVIKYFNVQNELYEAIHNGTYLVDRVNKEAILT